jgi:hypothetical protein
MQSGKEAEEIAKAEKDMERAATGVIIETRNPAIK